MQNSKDGGFSEGFWDGVEKMKEQNPGMTIRESGPIESEDAMVRQGSAYAKQGYDLVFIIHGAFVSVVPQLSQRFPDTRFCGILLATDAQVAKEPKNVCYFSPEQQIVSFMAGAAAALATKTHHIGSVAAIDFPALTEEMEGFRLGARCMDPNVKYDSIYTGDFNDPSKARAAGATLYSRRRRHPLRGSRCSGSGPVRRRRRPVRQGTRWVMPQYIDSYQKAPKVILTSAVYGLPAIAETMIKDEMAGKLKQKYVFNSQADGDKWSLAPFRDHEDVLGAENIEARRPEQKIKSGQIKVPNQFMIGKRESSTKIDPKTLGLFGRANRDRRVGRRVGSSLSSFGAAAVARPEGVLAPTLPPLSFVRAWILDPVASALLICREENPRHFVRGDSVHADTTLLINGDVHRLSIDTRVTLLDALRERLGLVGSKKGCDHGQCGELHGPRRRSPHEELPRPCGRPGGPGDHHDRGTRARRDSAPDAAVVHRSRRGTNADIARLVRSARRSACSRRLSAGWPSAVTTDINTDEVVLDAAEVRERMSGNLCRCGTYANIVPAILDMGPSEAFPLELAEDDATAVASVASAPGATFLGGGTRTSSTS